VVTDSDQAVLEFLAEHRVARAAHVAKLLDVSIDVAARRLRRLAKSGYVERDRLFAGQPHYASITREGLAATGSTLPAPRLDVAEYRHDIGMAWVWLAARDGAFGALAGMHSEREMRSADRRSGEVEERFGLKVSGAGPRGGTLTHYPDLLLRTAGGHRVAVELELTAKAPRRLDKIMRRYVADRRIDAVVYLVDDQRVARQVRAAAARTGASDLVHVQPVRFTEEAGPPARGSGRVPVRHRGPHRRTAELAR
jgi:hypothetical protein